MNRRNALSMAGLIVLVVGAGFAVQAQMGEPMRGEHRDHMHGPMDREAMMERCEQMMQRMRQMHERMQRSDEQLQRRIEAMDEAEGEGRIDAMADAIRTLAEQRRQMHQHRQQMMQRMMRHMSEHMMMDMEDDEARELMMRCPMMRRMHNDDDEAHPHENDEAGPQHPAHEGVQEDAPAHQHESRR